MDEEISSKDKALKELRQKQYQDVVNKFSMETLDVSKQLSGYDYSEEDFLTSEYSDILKTIDVDLNIFQDIKVTEEKKSNSGSTSTKTNDVDIKLPEGIEPVVVPFLSIGSISLDK